MPCVSTDLLRDCHPLLSRSTAKDFWRAESLQRISSTDELDDDEVLAQLGMPVAAPDGITDLQHVRSAAEKRAAEEIANRQKCGDFDRLEPLYDQKELS